MNREDFIFTAVFLGIVIISFALSFHMVNRGIEIDTTPLYWPETFPPDPEPPEDYYDCGEYHGKEGKSEYGEYEYNEWMEMQ